MRNDVFAELQLYKKMYSHLFNAITDAENLDTKEKIVEYLKEKQCETEEIYISFDE